MTKERKIVRCVNIDTNKVMFFPSDFCYNKWWQKTTRFIPQEIDIPMDDSTIINSISETLEVETKKTTNDVAISDVEIKTKRKYKKRKSNGND